MANATAVAPAPKKLTATQAKLVDEAADIVATMKKEADRLKVIKEKLDGLAGDNTYITPSGSTLTIQLRADYEPPTPAKLLAELKKLKMKDRFVDCVKVMVEASRKIVGEEAFNKLRTRLDDTKTFSFKKAVK